MDCFSLGKVIMENKHLTSQSGHAILNGYFESSGTRRALIYKNDQKELLIELWDDGQLVEVRSMESHNIYYAEDAAYNWISRVLNNTKFS